MIDTEVNALALMIAPETVPLKTDSGGVVRVGGTRVSLDQIVSAFNEGSTPEQIVDSFDTLSLADVYAAIAYYLRHRGEVDAYVEELWQQADEARLRNEARFDPTGVRERLLRRHASRRKVS